MKIYNFEQWTDEWKNIRKFKLTASNAATIAVVWKWLETYCFEIVADWFSKWIANNFTNEHLSRWNELEPLARELYELETWNKVDEVWFIEHNDFIGCSPDWLIWDDWWVEIKCLMDKKHFWHIIWEEKIDSWHIAQIQMCLFITGRKWWDYILFNPNYEKSLIIHRIEPDLDFFKKLEYWLEVWTQKIKNLKKQYETKKNRA